jgi:hypothetical protein
LTDRGRHFVARWNILEDDGVHGNVRWTSHLNSRLHCSNTPLLVVRTAAFPGERWSPLALVQPATIRSSDRYPVGNLIAARLLTRRHPGDRWRYMNRTSPERANRDHPPWLRNCKGSLGSLPGIFRASNAELSTMSVCAEASNS